MEHLLVLANSFHHLVLLIFLSILQEHFVDHSLTHSIFIPTHLFQLPLYRPLTEVELYNLYEALASVL